MAISTPKPISSRYFIATQTLAGDWLVPDALLEALQVKIVLAVGLHDGAVLIADIAFMVLVLGLLPHGRFLHGRQVWLPLEKLEVVGEKEEDDYDEAQRAYCEDCIVGELLMTT